MSVWSKRPMEMMSTPVSAISTKVCFGHIARGLKFGLARYVDDRLAQRLQAKVVEHNPICARS